MNDESQVAADTLSDHERGSAAAIHDAAIAEVLARQPFDPEALKGPLHDAMDDAREFGLHDWMEGVFEGVLAQLRDDQLVAGSDFLEFWLARFSRYQEEVGRIESAASLHQEYIDRFICDPFSRGTHLLRLGRLHELAGDSGSAEKTLLEGLSLREAMDPPASARELLPVLESLSQLYVSNGDPAKAEPILSRLVALLKADPKMSGSQALVEAVESLASVYQDLGRDDEARGLLESNDRPPAGMEIVDQGSFPRFIISNPLAVVVLVQPSEPNCDALLEMLEDLVAAQPHITFARVDVTRSPFLAAQMNVTALPTMALWKDGTVVAAKVGVPPRAQLEDWLSGLS